MTLTIRAIVAADRAVWGTLYAGYAEFYQVVQTEEMRDRVWGWLHDPAAQSEGLVAELDGAVIGFAHFREYFRPLAAAKGGFLDDLFVSPEVRGSGAADALIRAIQDVGRERGWTVVRWITAEDNYRARAVYDRLATRTKWVTYDLPV